MNREVRRKIEEKRRAWGKWKETRRECDRIDYWKKENEVKKIIRRRKNGWEKRVMEERKTNPKLFYSHINRAKTTRSKVAPLIAEGGEVVVDPKQQAELLNKYYI